MCHHEVHPAFHTNLHHLVCSVESNLNRLFDEDMLPRLKRSDADRFVHKRWEADVHHVDVGVGEKCLNLVVLPKVREIFDTAARTEISLNARPIAVQLFLIACTDSDYLSAGDLLCPVVVNHSHKTDADNSNPDHCFPPCFVMKNTLPRFFVCEANIFLLYFL